MMGLTRFRQGKEYRSGQPGRRLPTQDSELGLDLSSRNNLKNRAKKVNANDEKFALAA